MSTKQKTDKLLIRVGLINPKFKKGLSDNPYYVNKYIPVNQLKIELKLAREHYVNQSRLKTGLEFVEEYKDFPYYLNLMEFVPESKKNLWFPFKYCGIYDIDTTDLQSMVEYINKKVASNPLFFDFFSCWFTGSKGFRFVANTGIVNWTELLLNNREDPRSTDITKEFLLYAPSTSYLKSQLAKLKFYSTLEQYSPGYHELFGSLPYLQKYIDDAIMVPGHGTKFDIFKHPKTKKWPVFQHEIEQQCRTPHENKYYDPRKSLTNGLFSFVDLKPTSAKSPIKICDYWLNLLDRIETLMLTNMDYFAAKVEKSGITREATFSLERTSLHPKMIGKKGVGQAKEKVDITDLQMVTNHFGKSKKCILRKDTSNGSTLLVMEDVKCPIHDKIHSNPSKTYYLLKNARSTHIYCHCHVANDFEEHGIRIELQNEKEHFTGFSLASSSFMPDALELRNSICFPDTYYEVDSEYLGDIFESQIVKKKRESRSPGKPFLIFIKSGMGTGKTQSIGEYLKKNTNYTSTRVGANSVRITFGNTLSNRLDLKCYKRILEKTKDEYRTSLSSYNRLCISMESLHKTIIPLSNPPRIAPFDFWVMDEAETVLRNFNQATMNDRRENFLTFITLLKNVKDTVFVSDAILGKKTMQFFKDIGLLEDPNNYIIINNTKNKDSAHYHIYDESHYFNIKNKMWRDISTKNKIVIPCDNNGELIKLMADVVNRYQTELAADKPPLRYLLINSESSAEVKETSVTCEPWGEMDIVAFTPTITVGNSCEFPFTRQYTFWYNVVLPQDLIQMLNRVRNVSSQEKIIMIDTTVKRKPSSLISRETIVDHLRKKKNNILKEAQHFINERVIVQDSPFAVLPSENRALYNLFVDNAMEVIESKRDPIGYLLTQLKQLNLPYTLYDSVAPVLESGEKNKLNGSGCFIATKKRKLKDLVAEYTQEHIDAEKQAYQKDVQIRKQKVLLNLRFGVSTDMTDKMSNSEVIDFILSHIDAAAYDEDLIARLLLFTVRMDAFECNALDDYFNAKEKPVEFKKTIYELSCSLYDILSYIVDRENVQSLGEGIGINYQYIGSKNPFHKENLPLFIDWFTISQCEPLNRSLKSFFIKFFKHTKVNEVEHSLYIKRSILDELEKKKEADWNLDKECLKEFVGVILAYFGLPYKVVPIREHSNVAPHIVSRKRYRPVSKSGDEDVLDIVFRPSSFRYKKDESNIIYMLDVKKLRNTLSLFSAMSNYRRHQNRNRFYDNLKKVDYPFLKYYEDYFGNSQKNN